MKNTTKDYPWIKVSSMIMTKKTSIHSNLLCVIFLLTGLLPSYSTFAQVSFGVKAGYDQPLFSMPFQQLEYNGGIYLGANLDYRFQNSWGMRLDYANIQTKPTILIPNNIFSNIGTPINTISDSRDIRRQNFSIGPTYTFGSGPTNLTLGLLGGYSFVKGGDAEVVSTIPPDMYLVNTGFDDNAFSGKFDLDLNIKISNNLRLNIGAYYLRHFDVHFDSNLDLNGLSTPWSIFHGESDFIDTPAPFTLSGNPDLIVDNNSDNQGCVDLHSIGGHLGLTYVFGKKIPEEPEETCNSCKCPDDQHKVIVTVKDELSGIVIPEADVALKDLSGKIVASGTTNNFGVVDFGAIDHGNYSVSGLVYGMSTTTEAIIDSEFQEGQIIRKTVFHTDLRFILKGTVVNKLSGDPVPNTIVSLTNNQSRSVEQDNSDGVGAFAFKLDKNSSYQVVATKSNLLSDIEGVSTVGLKRSKTLFVNLKLGVDNFDCNSIAILDIKYDYDKSDLSSTARFELDRLVQYMKDNGDAIVELSSHTDSRGKNDYNYALSDRRARSAVSHIIGKGVPRHRIIAKGYGETRLRNQCSDGVQCSEEEHRINRRTEAKLICN